jgi:hypothetical protein
VRTTAVSTANGTRRHFGLMRFTRALLANRENPSSQSPLKQVQLQKPRPIATEAATQITIIPPAE